MTAFEQKFADASTVVENHNSGLSADQQLNWSQIQAKIKEFGGTSDDALREMTWEDLQDCGLPRLLARQIANQVFRKSDAPPKPVALTSAKVAMLTLPELFERYDITGDSNSLITERLQKESGGKRCVVLNPDGNVNIGLSATTLRELRNGFEERDILHHEGTVLRIVRVGERPDVYFDENPLDPGRPLRSDVCDKTGRSWVNTPVAVRQLLYLAVTQTKELAISNADDIHTMLDKLDGKTGEQMLQFVQMRYPRATVRFNELQQTNQLPTLKIRNGQKAAAPNDPFYSKHVRT